MTTPMGSDAIKRLQDELTKVGADVCLQGGDQDQVKKAVENAYAKAVDKGVIELSPEFAAGLIDVCVRQAIDGTHGISIGI